MAPRREVAAALAGLVLAPSIALADDPPTLADDGYHYELFQDGVHDFRYVEWWYFNLVDASTGLSLAFTYSIVDPDDRTGFGTTGLVAAGFSPGGSFQADYFLPPDRFHGSAASADVVVDGAGTIEVFDERTYRVTGAIPGPPSVSWDLTYSAWASPWLGGADERVGLFPWERMSWLVFMPAALVSGEVVVDGQVHAVTEASGYHDHNWGEWILNDVTWNWAQCSEPGFDLELGDFRRRPAGVLSVSVDGQRVEFEKGEYTVRHDRWERDPGTRRWYPTRTRLVASNEGHRLVATLRTLESAALLPPPEIPFLLLKPVIFEHLALCSGSLFARDDAGWRQVRRFRAPGFREYVVRVAASVGR